MKNPFYAIQRERYLVFDYFTVVAVTDWPLVHKAWNVFGKVFPRVDIVDDDNEIKMTAELLGIDKKDAEFNFSENKLLRKGQKKAGKKEKKENS